MKAGDPLLSCVPDEWGAKFELPSGAVTRSQTGPNSIRFNAPSHMALIFLKPQPRRELALGSDRKSAFFAPAGTVEIVPMGIDISARWQAAKENLLIALSPDRLSQLAGLEFQREDFEFQPLAAGQVDQKALMFSSLIRDETQDCGSANELYLDSLITAFSMHLLRHYSTLQGQRSSKPRGGLSPRARRAVEDYIQTHIGEDLSVNQLAQIAGVSPSHFLRAFRQTFGVAPYQYVLANRLELTERLIVSTDMPLAEIARIAGFASHSHMTSMLRRNKFTTPSALRRSN